MGLLRLMGNKADVVKGLAKRCNEKWSVAPKSDIVRSLRPSVSDVLSFLFRRAFIFLTSRSVHTRAPQLLNT